MLAVAAPPIPITPVLLTQSSRHMSQHGYTSLNPLAIEARNGRGTTASTIRGGSDTAIPRSPQSVTNSCVIATSSRPSGSSAIRLTPYPYLNEAVTASSSGQHAHRLQSRRSTATATQHAAGWTLEEARAKSKSRLHPVSCMWEEDGVECEALMASVPLLQKHMRKHYKKAVALAKKIALADPLAIFVKARCSWSTCHQAETFFSEDNLRSHVNSSHIRPLEERFCPYQGCPAPNLTQVTPRIHYGSLPHPNAYTSRDLRPHPTKLRLNPPPPLPPPIDPKLTWVPSPFGFEVRPFGQSPRGVAAGEAMVIRRSASRSSRAKSPPNLIQLKGLIAPDRSGPSVYFWPMGDAVSGRRYREAMSSSFFPHPLYTLPDLELDREDMDFRKSMRSGQRADPLPDGESPFNGLVAPRLVSTVSSQRQIQVHPRPDRTSCLPLPDAALFAQAAKIDRKRKRQEESRRRKGKSKAGDPDEAGGSAEAGTREDGDLKMGASEEKPLDLMMILRSSKKIAREQSGSTIGMGYWREKLAFEKAGERLGEVPSGLGL